MIDQDSTIPPQDPRLLRASPLVEDCSDCFVFKLFPDGSLSKEGPPATGRLLEHCHFIDYSDIWQGRCPPQGEGTFAYFCCRTKVWRLAGRAPPVLIFEPIKLPVHKLSEPIHGKRYRCRVTPPDTSASGKPSPGVKSPSFSAAGMWVAKSPSR